MSYVLTYMFGIAIGGLISLLACAILIDSQVVNDFIDDSGIDGTKLLISSAVLWPISMPLLAIAAACYCIYSVYAVGKGLIQYIKDRRN